MAAAQESDDLADTVDYGALAQTAAEVVGGRSYRLLEALAGRLASALLVSDARLERRRGHRAQAATAAGPRRGLDGGRGAPRPLMSGATRRAFIGLGSNLGDRCRPPAGRCRGPRRRRRRHRGLAPLRDRAGGGTPRARAATSTWWSSWPRRIRPAGSSSVAGPSRRPPSGCAAERWGPRTLDADVLWVEGAAVDEPDLTVPAPPDVGAALRAATAGRPGSRSGDARPAQGGWWRGQPCG